MTEDEEKCRHAGCSGYLTKPIEPARLLARLSKELARRETPTAQPNAVRPQPSAERARNSAPLVSRLPMDQPVFRELVEEFVDFLDEQIADMRRARATTTSMTSPNWPTR